MHILRLPHHVHPDWRVPRCAHLRHATASRIQERRPQQAQRPLGTFMFDRLVQAVFHLMM